MCWMCATPRSSRPGIWAWAAGISVALTFLCRQPAGILTFVAVFLTFLISARVRDGRFRLVDGQGAPNLTVTFTSGVALILSIFLAWLVSQGALHDWIFQQFTWPRMWLGRVGGTGVLRILQSLFPVKDYNSFLVLGVIAVALAFRTGTKKTWRFWLILALVVAVVNVFDRKLFLLPASWAIPVPLTVLVFFVVGFWALVRKRLILNFQLMPVAAMVLIGLASWAQYYPVHCINHIYWGLSPSIGFFIFLWFVAVRRSQWVTFGVISAFWLPGVAHDFKMIYQNFSRPLKVFEQAGPLTGMWVAPDHYTAWVQLIEAINQYLASRPATPMLIISIDALPATLVANLKNPGPFYVDWAITDLSAERVRFIDENLPLIFRKDVKVSPELEAAISRHHYELLASNPLGAVYGVPLL